MLHMADPPVRHGDGRGDGLERQQGAGPGCPERHASCQRRGARTVTRRSKPPPSTRGAGLRMGPTRRAPSARVAQEHGRHSCKAETAAGAAATIRGPRPMPGWARMGAAAAYWTRGGLRTEDPLGRQRDAHQAQESGATVRRDGQARRSPQRGRRTATAAGERPADRALPLGQPPDPPRPCSAPVGQAKNIVRKKNCAASDMHFNFIGRLNSLPIRALRGIQHARSALARAAC